MEQEFKFYDGSTEPFSSAVALKVAATPKSWGVVSGVEMTEDGPRTKYTILANSQELGLIVTGVVNDHTKAVHDYGRRNGYIEF